MNQVSFSVPRGATCGATFSIVVESGCGKTKLARMIVGLEAPTAGSFLFGKTRRGEGTVGPLRVQMIFQGLYASLKPRWRVGDIVAEPIRELKLGATDPETAERVAELLVTVGLSAAEAACSRTAPELMRRPRRSVACLVLECSQGAADAQISRATPSA